MKPGLGIGPLGAPGETRNILDQPLTNLRKMWFIFLIFKILIGE